MTFSFLMPLAFMSLFIGFAQQIAHCIPDSLQSASNSVEYDTDRDSVPRPEQVLSKAGSGLRVQGWDGWLPGRTEV